MSVPDVVIIILEEQLPGWGVCPLRCSVGFGGLIKSFFLSKKEGIIILVWYICIYLPYQNLDGRQAYDTWSNKHHTIEKKQRNSI